MFNNLFKSKNKIDIKKEERPKYIKKAYTFFDQDGNYVSMPKSLEGIVFVLSNIIETEMYCGFTHFELSVRVIDELLKRGWLPPNLTDADKAELLRIINNKKQK